MLWQVTSAPGLFSSTFVVCEPSAAEGDAQKVLRFAEGGNWHRFVLDDRIEIADNAPRRARVAWRDRQACQRSADIMHRSPFATETNQAKIREASAGRAGLTQRELDALNVAVCRCHHYRGNPRTSAAWEQIMPQVVCERPAASSTRLNSPSRSRQPRRVPRCSAETPHGLCSTALNGRDQTRRPGMAVLAVNGQLHLPNSTHPRTPTSQSGSTAPMGWC